MAKLSTQEQLEFQRQQNEFRLAVLDSIVRLIASVARYMAWVAVAGFVFLTIKEIAGKNTRVVSDIKAMVSLGADRWIYIIVAGLATGAWGRQKFLHSKARQGKQSLP